MMHDIKILLRKALTNFDEKFATFLVCTFALWFMRILFAIVCAVFVGDASASPRFVTPEMTLRRGLTDAQYEYLWSMGRNPRIDQATARNWIFTSSRYSNVTNWLNIVGETNDFARLAYTLQQQVFDLQATNATLTASNSTLRATCGRLAHRVEVLEESVASWSNAYAVVSGQLQAAQNKIESEITFLEQMKVVCDQLIVKYPEQREEIEAIKAQFQQRIEILRALTVPLDLADAGAPVGGGGSSTLIQNVN